MFEQVNHRINWWSLRKHVFSMCGHTTKYGPSLMLLNKAYNPQQLGCTGPFPFKLRYSFKEKPIGLPMLNILATFFMYCNLFQYIYHYYKYYIIISG